MVLERLSQPHKFERLGSYYQIKAAEKARNKDILPVGSCSRSSTATPDLTFPIILRGFLTTVSYDDDIIRSHLQTREP